MIIELQFICHHLPTYVLHAQSCCVLNYTNQWLLRNICVIVIYMSVHHFFYCQQDRSRNRFVILLGCAMFSVFGSNMAQFSGAGALSVLVLATVASHGWGDIEKVSEQYTSSFC